MSNIWGWFGEKKTAFKMWFTLTSKEYRKFHNVIIPSRDGTAQIDHLIISQFGIFIIETKNMKGWIFGSSKDQKWTQIIYGKKFPFQNPLRQTYRQKLALATFLKIKESIINDVVYFVGDCEFKTVLPKNVINFRLARYIRQYDQQILSISETNRIIDEIIKLRLIPNLSMHKHIESLHNRYSSVTICPKCGSKLVERTAKNEHWSKSTFLGCTGYPRCRYTKKIE